MKLVSHNDSSLNGAVHINEILKAGIFAIDEALREKQKTIVYDNSLFDGVNPDHVIPFSDDQVILYDFKDHFAEDVGLSLLHSMGFRFSALLCDETSAREWKKLQEVVNRLKGRPIYFLAN